MGDVLAGMHAAWEFDSDSVLIRYDRGIRTPKLFQALGTRRVPLAALAGVTLGPGRRGGVVLRADPRPGADPLMEAAAGQLPDGSDPYRLVVPAERATLAEYYADELRGRLDGRGAEPAARHLVAAPEPPLRFKAYDAKASFDGRTVAFRWSWTGASSAKWKAGDQSIPVADICGVEWRSPEALQGHLRLLGRDPAATPLAPDQDPAAVVFGLGYGPVHESLPFAAAVLAAARAGGGAPQPAPVAAAPHRDPADVADRIRHLGDLHRAGLVTDEEFSAKKAELLAEL
ncbi:DUF4429 domain-containing protein [Streptomyces sp. NPDC090306]|uniref:DUF4429 domain-containing protein n=1 Tax=unclassified Streptomyces TaxID=2593676 RepID=UPI0036E15626